MYGIAFVVAELIPVRVLSLVSPFSFSRTLSERAQLTSDRLQFFNQLLTIVSCLTSTWFVCGFAGMLWLHMNSPRSATEYNTGGWFSSPVRVALFLISVILVRPDLRRALLLAFA